MQLLVALHRAQGGVVTKGELVELCWDGRVVGEDAINRVVSRLRSASGKIGQPFRVETITKVGYRLAPANGHPPNGSWPAFQTADDRPRASLERRHLLIGGGAAAVFAAGALGWAAFSSDELAGEARLLVDDAQESLLTDEPDEHANAVAKLRRAAELAPASALVWGLMGLVTCGR